MILICLVCSPSHGCSGGPCVILWPHQHCNENDRRCFWGDGLAFPPSASFCPFEVYRTFRSIWLQLLTEWLLRFFLPSFSLVNLAILQCFRLSVSFALNSAFPTTSSLPLFVLHQFFAGLLLWPTFCGCRYANRCLHYTTANT